MWLIVGQMPIKAGWWDSSLAIWDFSQSNKHCIELSTANTIYICRSVISISAFRSSHPELFCKKGVLKTFPKFTGVSSATRVFCEVCKILKKTFFLQNLYSGCFWHLHQSRSPILMLYVINQQLRCEYVTILWWSKRLHFHLYFLQYFPQNFLHVYTWKTIIHLITASNNVPLMVSSTRWSNSAGKRKCGVSMKSNRMLIVKCLYCINWMKGWNRAMCYARGNEKLK